MGKRNRPDRELDAITQHQLYVDIEQQEERRYGD